MNPGPSHTLFINGKVLNQKCCLSVKWKGKKGVMQSCHPHLKDEERGKKNIKTTCV